MFLSRIQPLSSLVILLFLSHSVTHFQSYYHQRNDQRNHLSISLSLSQSSCCRFSIRGYRSNEIIASLFPSFSSSDHHIYYLNYKQPQSIGNYYAPEYTVQQGLGKQQQSLPTQRYFFKSQPETSNQEKIIQPSLRTLFEDSSSCCLVQLPETQPPVVNGWELFVSLDAVQSCWNSLMNYRCVPVEVVIVSYS